jgi:hypothetical protein
MADGDGAALANTTGGHNVAVGNATLFKNKVGNYNIDLGYRCCFRIEHHPYR